MDTTALCMQYVCLFHQTSETHIAVLSCFIQIAAVIVRCWDYCVFDKYAVSHSHTLFSLWSHYMQFCALSRYKQIIFFVPSSEENVGCTQVCVDTKANRMVSFNTLFVLCVCIILVTESERHAVYAEPAKIIDFVFVSNSTGTIQTKDSVLWHSFVSEDIEYFRVILSLFFHWIL